MTFEQFNDQFADELENFNSVSIYDIKLNGNIESNFEDLATITMVNDFDSIEPLTEPIDGKDKRKLTGVVLKNGSMEVRAKLQTASVSEGSD